MLIKGFEIYAGRGSSEKIWDRFNLERLLSNISPEINISREENRQPLEAIELRKKDGGTFKNTFFELSDIRPVQYFIRSGMMQFLFPFPIELMIMPKHFRSYRIRTKKKINLLLEMDN